MTKEKINLQINIENIRKQTEHIKPPEPQPQPVKQEEQPQETEYEYDEEYDEETD